MPKRCSRRKLLAASLGSVALAGCISTTPTLQSSWENEDEYPEDENRNRNCEIRDWGATTGTIKETPDDPGYNPYAYAISGRQNMHGTNQHAEIEATVDSDVQIIGTSIEDPVNHIIEAEMGNQDWPSESDILFEDILSENGTFETTLEVPDSQTHTIIFLPESTMEENQITIEMELDCSYYLPFEEYEDLHS